jgi:hypothetical protein
VDEAFVFVLGVPNLSGAVTASSEANLQIVRLSSACPPEAVRPHLQEGYLLGECPAIADFEQNAHYSHYPPKRQHSQQNAPATVGSRYPSARSG